MGRFLAVVFVLSVIFTFVLASCALSKVWREKNTGMEFVWIPGGCFKMGCVEGDKECYFDEKPARKVCVKGFWMSKYEVTVSQWNRFVMESNYKPKKKDLWGCEDTGKPMFSQGKDHPVVCVNWYDVKAFIKWLSKKTGLSFRLPTEAEWEYACKGGNQSIYACGKKLTPDRANYWSGFGGKSGKDVFKFTSPVGYFPPNNFGLYDMSGNVWEWVEDWYSIVGITSRERKKVIKGGGWESQGKFLRCSARKALSPDRNYDTVGFRLVVELPGGG